MDLNAEKSILIKELQEINDVSLLRAIKYLIHYGLQKEGRISLEQYNRELEEAEQRVAKGDFYTQEEVENMSKKW